MRQCSILLVDDEEEFVGRLAQRMRKRGLNVRIATSGVKALEKIEEAVPDVMVVDLNMPEMDGIEVIKRVKLKYPRVQILILTGLGSGQKSKTALRMGASACLEKPASIQEVISGIKDACDQLTATEGRIRR